MCYEISFEFRVSSSEFRVPSFEFRVRGSQLTLDSIIDSRCSTFVDTTNWQPKLGTRNSELETCLSLHPTLREFSSLRNSASASGLVASIASARSTSVCARRVNFN